MTLIKSKKENPDKKPRGRPPKTTVIRIVERMGDYVKKVDNLRLDRNIAENWKFFKQSYERFSEVIELEKKTMKVQVATLLNAIGDEAVNKIYIPSNIKKAEETVELVIKTFDSYCEPKKNEVYETFVFQTRNQAEGEPFENFLMEIRNLVRTCGFGNLEDRMLRDRIVLGVADKQLQKRLLETVNLDMTKAIDQARAFEAVKNQATDMQQQKVIIPVDAVLQKDKQFVSNSSSKFKSNINHNKKFSKKFQNRENVHRSSNNTCRFCLRIHGPRNCPAYKKKCNNCGKMNHFAVACTTQQKIREIRVSNLSFE